MSEAFTDARLRIARAKFHADEFRTISDQMVREQKYTHAIEDDGTTPYGSLKVTFSRRVDPLLRLLSAEVFWHLRSALDSTGYEIAVRHGVHANPQYAHFPFGDNSAETAYRAGEGRSRHLPPEIFTFMRKFKPYKGGNDLLAGLNEAANNCKHETIIPATVASGGMIVDQLSVSGGKAYLLAPPIWNPDENKLTLAAVERGAQLHYDLHLILDVSFNDPVAFVGKPAYLLLEKLVDHTIRTIDMIEAEARRLKYIT